MLRLFKWRLLTGLISIGLVLLVFFSNCGQVNIKKLETLKTDFLSTADVDGALKVPTRIRAHTRLILFIDHSYSMIFQGCPEDLDGTDPSLLPGPPCIAQAGSDYDGKRYVYTIAWLRLLWAKNESDVKVLILPFSGGLVDTNRKKNEPHLLEFIDLPLAINRLLQLQAEQENEKLYVNRQQYSVARNKKMGTSVPANFLALAKAKIQNEMLLLLQKNELYSTLFEFYYISDGELRPQLPEIEKAMQLANCPLDCVMDPTMVTCNNIDGENEVYDQLNKPEILRTLSADERKKLNSCIGASTTSVSTTAAAAKTFSATTDQCFCVAFGTRMAEIFGRYEDNNSAKILSLLTTISVLTDYYGQGQFKMKLVPVTDSNVPVTAGAKNLFAEITKMIPEAEVVSFDKMAGAQPIAATPLKAYSYKIDEFYAVNLTALQNDKGIFVADSDGDGLADSDEARLGFDPTNPRSDRRDAPICLDGIKSVFGCKLSGCDSALDQDGDGLNECEEMTLGTSPKQKDSSADAIFDSLKAIKDLSPIMNSEVSDLNSDAISDKQAFKWGWNPLRKTPKASTSPTKIIAKVDFLGYSKSTGSASQPLYKISASGIPLVPTLKVKGSDQKLFFDRFHVDPVVDKDILLATPHEQDINQILFAIKVRANENKDRVYWLVYKTEMKYGEVGRIELNLGDFYELRNTGWDL